jgi:glycosyltransferase involved in cell wall biosynthesis
MKVGIFLSSEADPNIGGGFSFLDRFIQYVDQFDFDPGLEICFVGRHPEEKIKLKKAYYRLSGIGSYRFYRVFERLKIFQFFRLVTKRDFNVRNNRDKGILSTSRIDVLLYVIQSQCEIYEFPFISVNWDIAHKSSYAFPEFSDEANFTFREHWYNGEIQKALAVFAESQSGRDELIKYCKLFSDRVFVVPLFPGRVVEMKTSDEMQAALLHKLGLKSRRYFYYPAQFWPHKNHYNLIDAFRRLKDRYEGEVKLVFTGSDQGNKDYINQVIGEFGLSNDVLPLGFVSNEEVYSLIRNATALVMPTFLGPTNMPLIEAQHLGTPVICTDFDGHREICQDAALYVDPLDSKSICSAMSTMLDQNSWTSIATKSQMVASQSVFRIEVAMEELQKALLKLVPLRKTFR